MFNQTYDRVLAYAMRRTDRAEAEDVAAETYVVAWRRFDDAPSDSLPWLYAVARRTLANSRRSSRRRTQLAARLTADVASSTSAEADPADRLEDATLMLAALRELAATDREVLMLVAWEGLDNERAARVLGITPQAFAVRLHRARRRLEAKVERHSGPGSKDKSSGE